MADASTKQWSSSTEGINNAVSSSGHQEAKKPSSGDDQASAKSKLVEPDVDEEIVNPDIDRGYAWIIVTASFLTSVIVDGVCYSFGIFLIEFLEYYGGSKAKMAWVGSVLNGTYLTIGELQYFHLITPKVVECHQLCIKIRKLQIIVNDY